MTPGVRGAAPGREPAGRVLLVDDDADFLATLRDLLEPAGYRVATATRAEGAVQAAQACTPDIALLDVNLRGSNGIDLIPALKDARPEIECIVMTAFAATENAVEAIRNGAEDYLNKPIDPADLMRALNRSRQRRRLAREKREAVAALRDSEARLRAIMDHVADALVIFDDDGVIEAANPAAGRMFGCAKEELVGGNVAMLLPDLESGRPYGRDEDDPVSGAGGIVGKGPIELKARRNDGSGPDVELAVSEARIGGRRAFIGAVRDVTGRKRLEDELRHAQKMQVIGELTGGVAHDFNNLLAVILGNAELLEARYGADDPQLQAVSRAANRGAELTRSLLAYSRQQPLRPEALDVAARLPALGELLTRTLGELIEIETASVAGLWPAVCDPGQLQSALLNLAVNAGQAMPQGGRLAIEAANVSLDRRQAQAYPDVKPGDFVVLRVQDTGTGMTTEVLERAFEPFFTTKEVGAGSGLGLSMVYGFAQQSGGFVALDSAPRRGTTARLYLPRAEAAAETERPRTPAPVGRGETVLVVEDDRAVRGLATDLLSGLGYEVVAARDGAAALSLLETTPEVALLLSDVVLPGGLCGPALAERARRQRPGLPVLFMSGYPDAAGTQVHPERLLRKPFRQDELARKLRATLEAAAA